MQNPFRERSTRSNVLTAAVNLYWTVVATPAVIALIWVVPPATAPAPEGRPGSGIIVRTEVTAIWMPRALPDLARHQTADEACRNGAR
jgi:hypothetical protein